MFSEVRPVNFIQFIFMHEREQGAFLGNRQDAILLREDPEWKQNER